MSVVVKEQWSDGSFRVTTEHDVSIQELNDEIILFIPNDCGGGYQITVSTKGREE